MIIHGGVYNVAIHNHMQASLSVVAEETVQAVSFQVQRGPGIFGTIGVMWEVCMDVAIAAKIHCVSTDHSFIRCQ